MSIGIFGYGTVGSAIYNAFLYTHNIFIYDKYKEEYSSSIHRDNAANADIIFVCVPTRTMDGGRQDLSEVYNALCIIDFCTDSPKEIVIKSTVLPGTTRSYSKVFPTHTLVFNPEFLTARTANKDFLWKKQIIIGTESTTKVINLYKKKFPQVPIRIVSWEIAELLKYTCNTFYATKITFANHIFDACKTLDIDYDVVKDLFIGNGWVYPMHLDVPGPDGQCGVGGLCLPKDTAAFVQWGKDNNLNFSVLKGAQKYNRKIRKDL